MSAFYKYIQDLEGRLSYIIKDGDAKVDSYYARLLAYIRSKILDNNALSHITTVNELIAKA